MNAADSESDVGNLFAIPFFALGVGILIVLNNERFEREKIRGEGNRLKLQVKNCSGRCADMCMDKAFSD